MRGVQFNMKTWEMIKELSENPKKEFKKKGGNLSKCIVKIEDGYFLVNFYNTIGNLISSDFGGGKFNNNIEVDDEWEEVLKQVDFMTAFNAWQKENKVIYCEIDGEKHAYPSYNKTYKIKPVEILKGDWFIKNQLKSL